MDIKKVLFFLILSPFVSLFFINKTLAADLYILPQSKTIYVGDKFSITIYVDSPDQAINAVSFIISYPSNLLKAESISKTGSLINLWAQEPKIENGTISGEGVILNQTSQGNIGFTGSRGKIITINFKTLRDGRAEINFSSGSVLANDGQGTNILKKLTGGDYLILVQEPVVSQPELNLPTAPKITSPTHPDQNNWYNDPNPKFTWNLPEDVTAVRLLYNKNPNSMPTIIYSPPIKEKTLFNVPDGVYWFHAHFRNKAGWGEVTHYKFQIDTTPPDLEIKLIPGEDLSEPKVKISFSAKDKTSGIAGYIVSLNDKEIDRIYTNQENYLYETHILEPKDYKITITAFDKAGNSQSRTLIFTIKPIASPEVLECPSKVNENDKFQIKGISLPDSEVILTFKKDIEKLTFKTKSDSKGNFNLEIPGLERGDWLVSAKVIDYRGAQSLETELCQINVTHTYSLLNFDILRWILILLLILLLIVYIWYYRKIISFHISVIKGKQNAAFRKDLYLVERYLRRKIRQFQNKAASSESMDYYQKLIKILQKCLEYLDKLKNKEI